MTRRGGFRSDAKGPGTATATCRTSWMRVPTRICAIGWRSPCRVAERSVASGMFSHGGPMTSGGGPPSPARADEAGRGPGSPARDTAWHLAASTESPDLPRGHVLEDRPDRRHREVLPLGGGGVGDGESDGARCGAGHGAEASATGVADRWQPEDDEVTGSAAGPHRRALLGER